MDEHQVTVDQWIDAKKSPIESAEGLTLALKSKQIHAAKGKKIVSFETRAGKLMGESTQEELAKAIIGPSGRLRAPSLWVGDTLYVGFNAEMYAPIAE